MTKEEFSMLMGFAFSVLLSAAISIIALYAFFYTFLHWPLSAVIIGGVVGFVVAIIKNWKHLKKGNS